MPPQEINNMTKQQKINAGIEKLKAKRAEAAEKKARDAANPPGKISASATATSLNQAPEMSTSRISSLPRMKKRPGKSMSEVAEKKATEEAVAAAKIQRKMTEKEDGEIDSDTEEIVYNGRMSNRNQNQKFAPVNNQKKFGRNENTNETRNTTKFKPNIKKLPPRVQRSQDLKKPEEKEHSPVKRKYFDIDSSDSEKKIAKPAKKAKTTKAGMDFENLPTKRKHLEEVQTSSPVKKQKITEPTKKSVAAPKKRAPVKKTKVRNNPTKNLLGFGGSKSTKKPVAPKKGPIQPRSVPEKTNENGDKSVENVLKSVSAQIKPENVASQSDSTTPSTKEPSKHRYLPDVSMEDLFAEASIAAAQPIESPQAASNNTPPRSAFDKVPVKTKTSRRGPTPTPKVKAPKVEVNKESASLTSMSTMELTRVAQPSRRKATPAPNVNVAQPSTSIRSPSSTFSKTSNKAQPSRLGATPASKDEVIKSLPSSIPLPTSSSIGEAQLSRRRAVPTPHIESKKPSVFSKPLTTKTPTKEAGRSTPSSIIPSSTAPRKLIKKRKGTDGVVPAPKSSVVDKMESIKGNTEEKPELMKVGVTEQPKLVAEINSSHPADANLEAEVLPETRINEDIVSLDSKVEPSSQAQRGIPQFLGLPGLQSGDSDKYSFTSDFFEIKNSTENFKNVTPNTELSDAAEATDTMELEFERDLQLELQNSFHAEQLRSALEEAIVLRAENGESSDEDISDDDSDEYPSGDESDEEQCKVTQRPSKSTVLYKGHNCVLQEEPLYARDRGYESGMSDADDDEDGQPSTLWHIVHGNKMARPVITKSHFKSSQYRISAFDQALEPAMTHYLEGKKARDAAAKEKTSPPVIHDPIFDDLYAYIDRCLGPRKARNVEPVMPSSIFDELEAEVDCCLKAQQDEDTADEKKTSSGVIPRSAFDEIGEEDFSSDDRHQQDDSEEIASAPVESSMVSPKSPTHNFPTSSFDFEDDFHGAPFEFNDASGQKSGATEGLSSLLDTSFNFSNKVEIPVKQSTTEDNDSDSTKESSNRTGDETPLFESPEKNTEPYVSPDGCIGLPPLEDLQKISEDSDDCDESDDEDSEMSESDGSEIIVLDDTTPIESEEDEDLQATDDDEDAELYRKHRVPADLANVEITMAPTELQLLKAKTSWELFELQKWEQENDVEVHATFDRELLLRNLNVSKKRIANYMKVLKKYENRKVPKAEVVPEDSSDDSDDEEFSHPTKLNIPQVVEVIAYQDNFPDVDIDTDVESNTHPFGPIDW